MHGTSVDLSSSRPVHMLGLLEEPVDLSCFAALKGEFEAEGLTQLELAAEVVWATRRQLDYLVKIGGCEAKSDIDFLRKIGVRSVVAPMIESPFAMSKYMGMLPEGAFDHVGVTIETLYAVERIEAILDAGAKLTNVTIGRSDLTASFGGTSTNSLETLEKTLVVARAAKARGLEVTMGGSVDGGTRALLRDGHELGELLDAVETRKIVMPIDKFLLDGVLEDSIKIECELLQMRIGPAHEAVSAMRDRSDKIRSRI